MATLESINNRIDKAEGTKDPKLKIHGNIIPIKVWVLHEDGSRELKIDNSYCEYESVNTGNWCDKEEFENMSFSEQREFIFTPNKKYQRYEQ